MAHWLVKSEPEVYGWDRMRADRRTHWNGVRNHQAGNNMKAMALGDLAFFYHSNEGKEIVGVVEVVRTHHPDPSDETGKFGMVEVAARASLIKPVSLVTIKADPALAGIALVRQSRLSVMPIDDAHWRRVLELAGGTTPVA
jgi:predicted RNA-binding protein with PUA-like domain